MKRLMGTVLVIGSVCAGALIAPSAREVPALGDDQEVRQSDRAFIEAVAKADKAALDKLLDVNFTWTDSSGNTLTREQVLQSLPRPASGYDAAPELHIYGQVAAVQAASGKVHVLRIWVKQLEGWRALLYHEVTQAEIAEAPGPRPNDCVNPCESVPYEPASDAENGVIKSWQELETAVTNHDPKAWAPHFADEFVLIASSGTQPTTKAGRIAQLSKPGLGPAPPGLDWARMYDYGETIVMVSQSRSAASRHISVASG